MKKCKPLKQRPATPQKPVEPEKPVESAKKEQNSKQGAKDQPKTEKIIGKSGRLVLELPHLLQV